MMVKTLQVAEASVVQPFSYLQLVFGSIIGVTIFSESIDLMIILGSVIVIGSGLFTTWREYKLKDKIWYVILFDKSNIKWIHLILLRNYHVN